MGQVDKTGRDMQEGSDAPVRHSAEHDRQLHDVLDVQFPQAVRGYDRQAVDRYIEAVGVLINELEASNSKDDATRRAIDEVSRQTRDWVIGAQQSAQRIAEQARERARAVLEEAEREAEATRVAAQHEADETLAAARDLAARIRADASAPSRTVQEILDVQFPEAARGYDRAAVDRYKQRVNALIVEFERWTVPISDLQRAIDNRGSDTRELLLGVQDSVQEITEGAHERARVQLEAAAAEADATRALAQREADELLSSARRQADELLSSARREADELH